MSNITRTAAKLGLLAVAMFGFGYAMVPLYNVFCDITGLNGKTGSISIDTAATLDVDPNRVIAVGFDTNTRSLPWEFRPLQEKVEVSPGQLGEARFVIENQSTRPMVGRAIPSVAPTQAAVYFNKTECFCFTEQTLLPGERLEVLVRFVVDTKMPQRFSALTLSYTFFDITDKVAIRAAATENAKI